MVRFDRIVILYGSETGNCQDLAKIVAWSLSKLNNDVTIQVMPCDDYPIQQLPNELFVLFICSTTGLGEEPLNMKRFWRFLLRRDLPNDSLAHLTFSVIGLGDSSYLKYNFVAKKLFKRLQCLGATNFLDLVLGDDQHELGPFVKIDPWLNEFYRGIFSKDPIKITDDESLIEPSFKITFLDDIREPDLEIETKENNPNVMKYDLLNPYQATVVQNNRLTSLDHFQDVRLMSVKLDESFNYNLGDVCVAYPENSDDDVETFLNMLNEGEEKTVLSLNHTFRLEPSQSRCWIAKSSFYFHLLQNQNPCTVKTLLKKYMDINSIPKRSFFDLFFRFSQNQLERDKLKRFASGADLDELYDYVNRPKRTILEVMLDFPHTTPYVPFEYLFDLIPAISPRPYSIASAPLTSPLQLDLLYAVVNYRTRLRKPRLGQCTNWLMGRPVGSQVSIFVRPSNFKLPPPSTKRPLIMIAAGTGVAPFRAFIHDRASRMIGDNYLFFGCRYRAKDYYLENEWNELVERNFLKVFVAFSRENPNQNKVYVQHVLWKERDLFYRLVTEQDAVVLVAGKSQQYPQLIRETIVNIFEDKSTSSNQTTNTNVGDNNRESEQHKQYEQLVTKLELQKRIQFECW